MAKTTKQAARSVAETIQTAAKGGTFPPIRPHEVEKEKLDSWFEGVSRPSQRIQDMARRKRHQHDALLRQLRQELFRERSAAESTVCFISANLRTELDKASLMVKLKGRELAELAERLCAEEAGPQGECRSGAFKEAVAAACDVVQQLTEQRTRAVDAFYDLLLDVEAEHQKRAKEAFRKYGDALQRNGHLPPQKIQPILDTEMKEVSELHLRHVISFGDLRLCLNMHAERDCRKFREALECSRRVHRERRQRAAVAGLQKAVNKSTEEHLDSTSMGRESLRNFYGAMDHLRTGLVIKDAYPFSSDEVNKWEMSVKKNLQKLDASAQKICSTLKETLIQIKMNSAEEIEKLKEFLIGIGLCSNDNFDTLYKNVCLPLLVSADTKINDDPVVIWKNWKQLFRRLNAKIDSLTSLLKDAGVLWENYCKLEETGRVKILQSLHIRKQDRGKHVEAKERRINLIIEASRQETKTAVIEDNVKRIFRILDEVKLSYESTHKQEREIIEGYTSFITNEIESLDSSKSHFMDKHKKLVIDERSPSTNRHTVEFLNKSEELLVSIELEENKWHDTIGPFLAEYCQSAVRESQQNWVTQQKEKLQEEYDCIAESHKLRYNQIQSHVQAARLAEISEHDKIFSRHKEVMTKVPTSIQRELEKTILKMFQVFQDLSSEMKSLKENGLHDLSVQSVGNTINQVKNCYEQSKESVKCLNDSFHVAAMQIMQKMKNNNEIFVQSLKLFSDGGDYAEPEIKNIKSELRMLELDDEANVIKKGLSLKQKGKECCTEALKYLKICLRDLQVHLENLSFTESISSIVQKTQAQLSKHVLALKYGGKLLYEQATKLLEGCDRKDATEMRNEWRYVTETISKRHKWLLGNEVNDQEDSTIISSSSIILIEYRETDAFLSIIHNLLRESVQQIKTAVEEFHQRKSSIDCLNTSILQDEINNYMSEISSKYKAYQEQCIEVWMCEVTGFLDSIKILNNNFYVCCNQTSGGVYENLAASLEVERNLLNDNLMKLRLDYQQHQVETMAKLGSTQKYHGNQFSALCSRFEETSRVLSDNIENLIHLYMEKAQKYLNNFEEETKEHHIIIMETVEYLSGEISEKILLNLKKEVLHIYKHYMFDLPASTALFCHQDVEKHKKGTKYRNTCAPVFLPALGNLCTTADQFWTSCKQVEELNTQWNSKMLQNTTEGSLQEARKLVQSKTLEVKKLYEQYKNMTEELRMKWRSTSHNIERINVPICSLPEYK